jgi:hypothetical protein
MNIRKTQAGLIKNEEVMEVKKDVKEHLDKQKSFTYNKI